MMKVSSVRYVRNAKLRGKFFDPDDTSGLVSSVDTGFYVYHQEPLEALAWVWEANEWPLDERWKLVQTYLFNIRLSASKFRTFLRYSRNYDDIPFSPWVFGIRCLFQAATCAVLLAMLTRIAGPYRSYVLTPSFEVEGWLVKMWCELRGANENAKSTKLRDICR